MLGWSSRAIRARAARGSPWLPGADQHDAVARNVAGLVLGQKTRQIGEIAVLARRLFDPPQRAPDQRHLPLVRGGGQGHRFEPRHVRGKAGDRNAGVIAADQIGQRSAQLRLGPRCPGAQRVCRVADQSEDALVAELAQPCLVRGRTDQRVRIELPVAGVQHRADRRPHGDSVRFGDRMGQSDQLKIERADREAARQRDHVDPDLVGQSVLGQLCAQQRGGERGRPNRAAQLAPQIGNGPDVILVRVRRHNPEQAVPALGDEGRIRHHDIEARLGIVSERYAAVDDQPVAGITVDVEVHPDFPGAAERDEIEGVRVAVVLRGLRSHRYVFHCLLFR